MKNRLLSLCFAMLALFAATTLQAKNEKPFVIPELRHWQGGDGVLAINSTTKVLYTDPALANAATALAEDYGLMFGKGLKAKAVKDATKTPTGAIVISLTTDKELGDEGYSIEIGDGVVLKAQTATGAYWGTRTLLQILEQNAGTILPKGSIRDWPDYAMRGFMIDCGRKYIPLEYLNEYAKIMAYYKMNTFQIHLNDRAAKKYEDTWDKTYTAFRLESELFPELTAKDGHYGKDEFRQFQKNSAKICVNVIPEIDVPSHSLAFSRFRKEFGSEKYGLDHLDLYNPNVYTFLDSLFTEYLEGDDPVFVGKQVHIGTDEYSNKDKDVVEKFRAFTDRYIRFIEKFGKQACVWGALTHAKGETPVKAENVIMHCWYNPYANPADMKKLGYQIVTVPSWTMYIVPAAGYYADYINHAKIYNDWDPTIINQFKFEPLDPSLLGSLYCVWNDIAENGISVDDIHHRCYLALQVISAKTWSPTYKSVPFDEFDKKREQLHEAPGVNELGRFFGKPNSLVYSVEQVKAGKRYPCVEAGFDHTISFHIDCAKESRGTLLFSNDVTEFYLSSPIDGRMAFVRDGYLNSFDYYIEQGKSADIRIECTNTTTRLYVDGKLQDELKREKRWITEKKQYDYVPTLYFPLQQAGQFKSRVTDLKVENFVR
ncbi:MAG: family 20 glycosylhydrolase [Alistipes sp.]|nr:family 20 glycosylhydrolase [Alistipes sp.]